MKIDPELRGLIADRLRRLELARERMASTADDVRYHERVLRSLLDVSQTQTNLFVDRYARLTRRWRKL